MKELFGCVPKHLYGRYPQLASFEEGLAGQLHSFLRDDYDVVKDGIASLMSYEEIPTGHEMQPSMVLIIKVEGCGVFHFQSEIEMPGDSYYYKGVSYRGIVDFFCSNDDGIIVINKADISDAVWDISTCILRGIRDLLKMSKKK